MKNCKFRYLNNYFNFYVCLSLRRRRRCRHHVPLPSLQFLQAYDKVSLIKFVWYVLRVKNIYSWSPPDPFVHETRRRQVTYIMTLGKRKLSYLHILKLASVFHHLPSVGPKQLCVLAHLGCTREAGTS